MAAARVPALGGSADGFGLGQRLLGGFSRGGAEWVGLGRCWAAADAGATSPLAFGSTARVPKVGDALLMVDWTGWAGAVWFATGLENGKTG